MKLSVIIPSWKDPYLVKTIRSLLDASELGESLEVVAIFDGYWPDFDLVDHPCVRYVHLGKNRGMRGAINAGVAVSRGEFIMRTDEHCLFGKGYDRIMTESCQPNWIMTAKRYFLNPEKWEVMGELRPLEYEKLVIQNGVKFSGQRWPERDEANRHETIGETMAMQGSMWLMPRLWWDLVIGELQTEGYGPHYQDSHEMVFKTWQAGGKLMLHKGTWFAHKHRSFSRTHREGTTDNPANRGDSWQYALNVWRNYYEHDVKPRWGL